jgi:tetratricopeptide (TPR) repeat protein
MLVAAAVAGCPASSRGPYQQGMMLLQAGNYSEALAKFEASLEADPTQRMPLFGKARCLYELGQYEDALKIFEIFLSETERDRAKFSDERYDAEFYRDKCKLELGMEVPQNEDAIPEERMRY